MTEPSDRRFCPQCGGARIPAALFCEFCGARLAPGDVAAAAAPGVAAPGWRVEIETALRRGDLARAASAAADAVTAHPDDPDAFALQAHVALEQLRATDAWTALERALALAPRSPFVRLQVADYWLRLGVTPRAVEELQAALALCSGDDPLLEAHIRRALATVRAHTKAEFGPSARGGFGHVVRTVQGLFQSKRARRRSAALNAAPAPSGERGL
jgi:hypothetical protein